MSRVNRNMRIAKKNNEDTEDTSQTRLELTEDGE